MNFMLSGCENSQKLASGQIFSRFNKFLSWEGEWSLGIGLLSLGFFCKSLVF